MGGDGGASHFDKRWTQCHLSKAPLVPRVGVVADELGNLYGDEGVPEHIRGLRDVVTLSLHLCCPVTLQTTSGKAKFFFGKACGCEEKKQRKRGAAGAAAEGEAEEEAGAARQRRRI
eukprot:gene50102-37124_t